MITKKPNTMKKLFIFMIGIFTIVATYSQTTIWSENFTSEANNATTGNDDNTTDTGADWTTSCSSCNKTNEFRVENNKFQVENTDEIATWTSEVITLTGYTNISSSVSIDMDDNQFDATDCITISYKLDGGAKNQFPINGNLCDDGANPTVASVSGLSGSTFQIIIDAITTNTNEDLFFDDILVQGDPTNDALFTSPSISISNDEVSVTSTYTFSQTVPSSGSKDYDITSGGTVTLTIPNGDFSTATTAGSTFNGSAIASFTSQTATTISFNAPVAISEGVAFDIIIANVTNHSASGTYSTATVTAANDATGDNSYTSYSYTLANAPARVCDFSYKKDITIDNTKVSGSSDLSNFPMLMSFTDNDLKTTGNGGHVENTKGYDIVFRGKDCDCILDHQIEEYIASTGEYIAWVKIPTLKYNSDTEIEMYYGNSGVSSDYSTTEVWDANYVGVWHMNQNPSGSAPQIIDYTSNSNDGTSNGSMITGDLKTGKIGQAIEFDGNNDYIDCGNDASLQITGDITMEAWIYTDGYDDYDAVITKTTTGSWTNGYGMHLEPGEDPAMYTGNWNNDLVEDNGHAALNGAWHHMVATHVSGGGTSSLYVDGVLIASNNESDPTSAAANVEIGRGADNQYNWIGELDEIRLSNTVRSADWIATEYANQNAPGSFYTVGSESSTPCDVLYCINSGNINAEIWALKSAGTTCYCTPDAETDITVEGGHKVTVNTNASIGTITLGTGVGTGELEWGGNYKIDIYDAAGVTVAGNGTIDRNGNDDAQLEFDQGTVSYTFNNKGSVDIGDIRIGQNNSLTLSGSANTIINDELCALNENAVFTNNSTGTLYINDDIDAKSHTLTINNNGAIDLADEIINCVASKVTFNNNTNANLSVGNALDLDLQLSAAASGNTVTYDRAGDQNIIVPTDNYHHLNLTSSGNKSSAGTLDIRGDLIISGTAVLDIATGSDDISILGDWTSTGSAAFSGNNRTITFTGGNAQQLTVPGGESFYNLVINKSANQLTINDNLTISNALTLTDGEIITGSDTVIITSTTAANLSGHSGASFIYGNLIRYIDNGGANTDTYAFPVGLGIGSGKYYRGDIINNGLTGLTHISCSVGSITESGNNTDDKITASQDGTGFTNIYEEAIWHFSPNAAIGGSYGVCLHTTNIPGLTDNKFAPLKRPDGSTSYADFATGAGTAIPSAGASGRTVASGIAIRTGYTSFSEHAVGGGDSPLPIELLSFEATLEEQVVDLAWKTATEINNDFFTVERSDNGVEFEEVLKADGAGNSNVVLDYFETDYEPLSGVSYYRLKQTDYDGQYSYSDIVVVSTENPENDEGEENLDFTVFPNPSDGLNINVRSNEAYKPWEEINMSVADLNGKEYYSKVIITNNTGEFFTAIDPYERIPTGLYVVIGTAHEDYYSQILVIE